MSLLFIQHTLVLSVILKRHLNAVTFNKSIMIILTGLIIIITTCIVNFTIITSQITARFTTLCI